MININCIYNDKGCWCKNKNIKKSLLGFGARMCVLYDNYNNKCEYQKKHLRPNRIPPSPNFKIKE